MTKSTTDTSAITSTPLGPSEIVYASAVVKSKGGKSMFDKDVQITLENVEDFDANPNKINEAKQRLRKAGFKVGSSGTWSVAISAPAKVFNRVFKVEIVVMPKADPELPPFITCKDSVAFGFIDPVNSDFKDILAGINLFQPLTTSDGTIERPKENVELLQSEIRPEIKMDWKDWYLQTPKGIQDKLNASRPHDDKIKGKGVNVMIIDGGFHASHNYFNSPKVSVNYYDAFKNEWLNKLDDPDGHGTKCGAAFFSIAPEANVTFVPGNTGLENIKAFAEKTNNIKVASLSVFPSANPGAKHHMLKMIEHMKVDPKFVYVVAYGNGGAMVPGALLKNVIAVGGAFYKKNILRQDIPTASDCCTGKKFTEEEHSKTYSSFSKTLLRIGLGPDVCGLVGNMENACYTMYPVRPGKLEIEPMTGDLTPTNEGWGHGLGTSFAAPQVAGVVALMKQVCPEISLDEIKTIFRETCNRITDGRFANNVFLDLSSGLGLVDAEKAVNRAKEIQKRNADKARIAADAARVHNNMMTQHTGTAPGQAFHGIKQ
jgi:serine protease AprX